MSNINIPTQVSPFVNRSQFPALGKIRVIYIDQTANVAYYWNNTSNDYVELGAAVTVNWGDITGTLADQTDLQNALNTKVDKVTGKGLSTNDYTTTEKNKLAGIEAGAQVNVNADWNATTGDAEILNKPTIPSQTSDLTNDGENGINPFITAVDIPGSLPPSGTAGGDLTGTYPNPTVHKVHGIDMQTGTPSADDVWVYGGSPAKWRHQHLNASQVDNDSSVTGANVELALEHLDSTKQPLLVSATNIKTINGSSVLGSGNLVVSGGGDSGFHGLIKPTSALFPNGLVTSFINTTSLPNILQTANRITAYPFVPASTMTSTALVVRCAIGVASALGRIVIYSNVNGEPSTILYQSANLDCSISGDKTVTTAFTFTQGVVYWLAFHSSGLQTMSGIQASSMIPIFSTTTTISNHFYRGFSFASGAPSPMLPDTYASGTVTNIGIKLT